MSEDIPSNTSGDLFLSYHRGSIAGGKLRLALSCNTGLRL